MFRGTLEPGESIELPMLLFGTNPGGMDALCGGIADWLETNWMPPSRIPVPTVEWNHWWTYEDVEINETVFLENARAAKQLGVTLCTLDPGLGCKRDDHGHQEGLGMFFHVKNYYRVLDRLREKYPKLILENCSSGGLRFDLEMFRHTDVSFLSDPDELPHSQQCVWGASCLVYPHRLLHWAPSQTRRYPDGSHVFPSFEITEETPEFLIRGSLRNAMPHQLGICRNLTALPEHARNIFADEIGWYRETVAPLLSEGHLEVLTSQPMRW